MSNSLREHLEKCRVKPGASVHLKDYDPGWNGDPELLKEERKKFAEKRLKKSIQSLADAQELLYASDTWSILIVFQAMDSAGKDSAIRHVMTGVNPQGCQVHSFKHPSAEELDHTFLWRCMKALPERGRIGIFNRSYYEEVLVVRVHEQLLANQKLPEKLVTKSIWKQRYDDINRCERHLVRNGTVVLKFFLHMSKEEQKKRFLARLDEPDKHWKFSPDDVRERQHWDEYMRAYEAMLTATSTDWAPWYVVPADHKWITRAVVS